MYIYIRIFLCQYFYLMNLAGVICPIPNETDHLVLLSNLTEYRFGDTTTFDCVGDFELSSKLAATRHCVVDDTNLEVGKWTGEIPFCQGNKAKFRKGIFCFIY